MWHLHHPPPEKSHPLFHMNPPLKVEVLSSPPSLFENLVGGSTHPTCREGGVGGCTLCTLYFDVVDDTTRAPNSPSVMRGSFKKAFVTVIHPTLPIYFLGLFLCLCCSYHVLAKWLAKKFSGILFEKRDLVFNSVLGLHFFCSHSYQSIGASAVGRGIECLSN